MTKSAAAGGRSGRMTTRKSKTGVFVGKKAETGRFFTYATVKSGLAARQVEEFLSSGRLNRSDVRMVVPDRTFERRLSENQVLKIDEADAIFRLIRVRDHALRVFDTRDRAERWLGLPNPELDGSRPIEMARTDIGAREVEGVLGRIEHGIHS